MKMNELKKSTTVELTINPGYVKDWGIWEAVREFVQNGLDSHDNGFHLSIERGGGESKTVRIRNVGTTLDRRTLLLGASDKDGTLERGKFGEGYKLGLLTLSRL